VEEERRRGFTHVHAHQKAKEMITDLLKRLDSYPKVNEDFATKTRSGGVITIVALTVMAVLFWTEMGEEGAIDAKTRRQNDAKCGC